MASQVDPQGSTPLKYLKRPYKLLRPGADATITDGEGNGAFHYLVQSNMFEPPDSPDFLTLIGRPPSPVDDPSMTMERLIQGLQAAGAQINLQNKKGETPLHAMFIRARSYYGRLDERLLECMCEAGADLNIRDYQGRSAAFSLFVTDPLRHDWKNDGSEHLCQLISRLGGRFDARDSHGRTVLHCLLSGTGSVDLSLVDALARHGVDPSAVDDEGNTLWHVAVDRLNRSASGDRDLSDLLLRLGADPQKPNHLGRNPLHGAASSYNAPFSSDMTVFPACIPDVTTTALDRMLQLYLEAGYDLDLCDHQGITPLHLACTFSEYQATRLLKAGASPKIPTHEGLTPLHLAARCRQANVIGLLLDEIKQDEGSSDGRSSSATHGLINAKDAKGNSALYYACASGMAESVALLLEAGASAQCEAYSGSVWEACAEFEQEQLNWSSSPPARGRQLTASSVLIEDKGRPATETGQRFPREHLGDVLRLLLESQDDPDATAGYLEEAISAASAKQLDYTVWCLVVARKSLVLSSKPGTASFRPDETTSACLARFDDLGITEAANLSPKELRAEFERLMGLRRHDLVQKLLLERGWGELSWSGNTIIHDLVRNGLVSVLQGLKPLVRELSAKLEDMEWCARQNLSPSSAPTRFTGGHVKWCPQPLLPVACRSEEPNMEMVRFLVEEIGCGVDAQGYVRIRFPDSPTRYGLCKDDTPIHALVRGNLHWWHTWQALPYLARDRGANLEIRDAFRSTPLAVAVSHAGRVTFNRAAVDALLEFGADAKAVDLNLTSESAEVTRLLLSKGAIVKPSDILAAVRSRNCDFLNLLLSGGGDVNARETSAHQRRNTPTYVETATPPRELTLLATELVKCLEGIPLRPSRDKQTPATPGPFVPEEQMYPLDLAAHLYARQPEVDEMLQLWGLNNDYGQNMPYARDLPEDELEKVIETLVARGADVMATYTFSDGASMSIKDRIVLRGKEYGTSRRKFDRPRRARRIFHLCNLAFEGDL